ncbi:MAG: transketolase [Deltaproteobacteria bacterium]|nr:transketolase [Deltaproteobacteria bacterium]
MNFPLDLSGFVPVPLDLSNPQLSLIQRKQLEENIQLCRDAVIITTAMAEAKGLGAHTGGAYDIVPEIVIADGFMRASDKLLPICFDEAGHRVAIQYILSVIRGHMPAERLCHYREYDAKLPGHPERDFTPGIEFTSGRLGHLWPYINGVAMAHPDKAVLMFGSDGAQQEGDDAEAARFAVAHNLNVKLAIDDNNVTISGHPKKYMPGFDLRKTLKGHGLKVDCVKGENLEALYRTMQKAVAIEGPVAMIIRRKMAPGVKGIEGTPKGHDAIKLEVAFAYLEKRGLKEAVATLKSISKPKRSVFYLGSSKEKAKNRTLFGDIVCEQLKAMSDLDRKEKVRVFDSDLEGSCGLTQIRKAYPEIFVSGGVMERGNFSAAAGFGMEPGRQGIFATFSAFLEMVVSEITMARFNHANVLAHFSHAGVDDMADNTTHFGINAFFAHNGLCEQDNTRLYFPADRHQIRAVIETVFFQTGLRFVFTNRSALPDILREDGRPFYADGYTFVPGKDDIIREGSRGYIVSYGDALYRALDAVERLRKENIEVGLVNKTTLNVIDSDVLKKIGQSGFVLVVESQNQNTGLGMRFGTWLLEQGLSPKYVHIGLRRKGNGGLEEQMAYQGLDPESIISKVKSLSQ